MQSWGVLCQMRFILLWVGRAARWLGRHQEADLLLTADPLLCSSAPVVTGDPDQPSCVCVHVRVSLSAAVGIGLDTPVQLSPQRGKWDDGYDCFAPMSSEVGTGWPLAASPCSPPKTSKTLSSTMKRTVDQSPVQLSCWEESASPHGHMHVCSHMPTHVQEATRTHTNTHVHCEVLVRVQGLLPWMRARPLL